ncbi:MAG: DUF2931 family protein [Hymenobacter sp.]|nr:DUF2931 family protein [Hymenobacter sp.]
MRFPSFLVLFGLLLSACGSGSPPGSTAPTTSTPPAAMADAPLDLSERFALSASPGCADGYPATIDEARFLTPSGGFPVPYGHFLNSGWGGSAIGWSVGDPMQAAPDSLEIRWFSYTEDKFYEGHFLLPQERIYQLLKAGVWDAENQEQVTYNDLSLSVVPGGVVFVWLAVAGANQVLIGRYAAQEIPYDYARHRPKVDRAADVADTRAKLAPEVRREIATRTISSKKWDAWLERYPWQLAFSQALTLTEYGIGYLNAESTSYPPTPDTGAYAQVVLAPSPKPVPSRISFHMAGAYGRKKIFKVRPFDEAETMGAFQILAAAHPGQPLTLFVEMNEQLTQASLSLRAGKQVIPLTKSPVQLFDPN